jgi:uncharacterized protein (DUF58 family)
MPTKRTSTLLIAALLLYFFANQTQVGWLYVMSALLAGSACAAWLLNRGMLKRLSGERTIDVAEIHEGESLSIRLKLRSARRTGAAQIHTVEHCPLADPTSDAAAVEVFIPLLPARGSVEFAYTVDAYRRGLHTFPPLALSTRAPFGFAQTRSIIDVPTRALIYPEVHKLHRLSLLDRQPAAEQLRPRPGFGAEVIGVRPFRTGDSPRHIHWRSTARTGQLISKEFADESHPSLTIVLDLQAHPYAKGRTKHTPFEWSIKAAVSIAEYALRRGYNLHLAADGDVLALPPGPITWWALMQYLARIEPTGAHSLAEVIERQPMQTYAAVLIPYPDRAKPIIEPLVAMRHRGIAALAVVLDPSSFPDGGPSGAALADEIQALDIDSRLLRFGEDWAEQLSDVPERQEAGLRA